MNGILDFVRGGVKTPETVYFSDDVPTCLGGHELS
jgi:hypothetical protein